MTHGSLFTGIGGFDLGFERAGMESVWQVEKDDRALDTLSVMFPEVERFEDVKECTGLRSVDVVSGGFPCQDLSVAGRRAGLAGERSGLWFEFHRILSESKPRWTVIENVPGLLSSNKGKDFAVIVQGLVKLGYGVCWRVLDAQYFGVAQRRRRVFVVGSLGDYSCVEVLFESEGLSGDSAPSKETKTEIAHTLRSRSSKSGVPMPGRGGEDDFNVIVSGSLHDGFPGRDGSDATDGKLVVNYLNTDPYADRAAEETKLVVNTLDSGRGGPDDNSAQARHLVVGALDSGGSGRVGAHGGAWPGTTGQSASQGHAFPTSEGVRRLTPTECERLQGFPDGWTGMHKDTVRYRQIGNAVAVPVAEWIGNQIVRVN